MERRSTIAVILPLCARFDDGILGLDYFVSRDAEVLERGDHDPEHRRRFEFPSDFVPSLKHSEEVIAEWERERAAGTTFTFAVRLVASGTLVGGRELKLATGGAVHLSYWTYPEHRRQGFASRAVALGCDMAFREFGCGRVELFIDPDNIGSILVAHRNGFREIGRREARLVYVRGS